MKKITVTVGIPAFNEELNIEAFLLSVIDQNAQKIAFKEIYIYSDASSDKTDEIVERLAKKYSIIKLIKGKTRKGKYFRVNQLFALCKTDVLIILDADIALKKKDFLETLAQALISDEKAAMMAAHVELIRPQGFIAKVLHASFILGDFMRWSLPGYDIAENFHGAATAYKKSFLKTIAIPTNLSDPHLYIYLWAKKSNGFRYCPQAVISQYAPSTIADVKQLMERSIGKRDPELEKIFGEAMIRQVHFIPKSAKIKGVIKCFLWNPIYAPLAIIISFYLGRMVHPDKVNNSPIWEINKSTKKRMSYAK
ncbi:MAG TPA: glycosyltransferase [Candidatus Saccharimonadales bacterium]|nr:glycosyltransferase [Candidatus Saccharimonadales bacterium]